MTGMTGTGMNGGEGPGQMTGDGGQMMAGGGAAEGAGATAHHMHMAGSGRRIDDGPQSHDPPPGLSPGCHAGQVGWTG